MKCFKKVVVGMIYVWGRLFYKKQYLQGKLFDRNHFTFGWKMILRYWFVQKVIGVNRKVPWPVSPLVKIGDWKNIQFDPDDIDNFVSPGDYYQAINGKIIIGKGTKIAPGVGLITANHSLENIEINEEGKDIYIGDNSWIGMNVVILPGVILGAHTVVGAGSVVTKSFKNGNCVIAGNPAKIIREL